MATVISRPDPHLLRVAFPTACNTQQNSENPEICATSCATTAQQPTLRALALLALRRNSPATAAQQPPEIRSQTEQQIAQENGPSVAQIRAHLLTLAESDGLPESLVHDLDEGDLDGCRGCTNATLRTFLRALGKSAAMDAGRVPDGFTVATRCPQCGPVWLSEEHPPEAKTCPWCFRRRAGKSFPVPLESRDLLAAGDPAPPPAPQN